MPQYQQFVSDTSVVFVNLRSGATPTRALQIIYRVEKLHNIFWLEPLRLKPQHHYKKTISIAINYLKIEVSIALPINLLICYYSFFMIIDLERKTHKLITSIWRDKYMINAILSLKRKLKMIILLDHRMWKWIKSPSRVCI